MILHLANFLNFTDNIIELLVTETNKYAEQFLEANREKRNNSYLKYWEPVSVNEMKKFIGIMLFMGIVYKPSIHMYWSIDELYATPVFSELMPRDRFRLIMKFFHINDNDNPDYNPHAEDRDRLYKIRPFLDMIHQRFRNVYSPGREICVDESLVLFKGRLHFKQ